MHKYFIYFILFLSSSCISTRNIDILKVKNDTELDLNNHNYKLNAGDLLSVQISSLTPFNYDFFNKESQGNSNLYAQNPYLYGYRLNAKGELDLPTMGTFNLLGKTLNEAEEMIRISTEKYFSEPFIKLNILDFGITIMGEVNNPGKIQIYKSEGNLVEAIGMAGGFTEFANRKKVKVIRISEEKTNIFFLDLTNKSSLNEAHFFLQPNDIISVVPMNKRFFTIDNLPLAISTVISAITLFLLIQPD